MKRCFRCGYDDLAAFGLLLAPGVTAQGKQEKPKRPKLSVRASPMIVFTPAMITLTAELKGGGHAALDWSPDDKTLLVGEYVSVNESYLWLMPVDGAWMLPLAAPSCRLMMLACLVPRMPAIVPSAPGTSRRITLSRAAPDTPARRSASGARS